MCYYENADRFATVAMRQIKFLMTHIRLLYGNIQLRLM